MSLFFISGQAYVLLILGLTFMPNVTLTYGWTDFFKFPEETDDILLMSGQAFVRLSFDLLGQEYVTPKFQYFKKFTKKIYSTLVLTVIRLF